jgi:hypothetical protein
MFRITSVTLSRGRLDKEMCGVQVHCDKNQDNGVLDVWTYVNSPAVYYTSNI